MPVDDNESTLSEVSETSYNDLDARYRRFLESLP